MVGSLGISTISEALHLHVTDVTRLGGDVQIRMRSTRHTVEAEAAGTAATGGGS
jgi:diaminohydroxyphosphoribosylaminopyrimidine deaminase/5-amino-6-(5-phosphoribosylamino)uracil reductase